MATCGNVILASSLQSPVTAQPQSWARKDLQPPSGALGRFNRARSLQQHPTVSFLRQPDLQLRIQTLQQSQIHQCKPQRSSNSRNSLKLPEKSPHLTSSSFAAQQPAQSSAGPAAPHIYLVCSSQHRNALLPIRCFTSCQLLTALLQGEGLSAAVPCPITHHQALGLLQPLLLCCSSIGLQAQAVPFSGTEWYPALFPQTQPCTPPSQWSPVLYRARPGAHKHRLEPPSPCQAASAN